MTGTKTRSFLFDNMKALLIFLVVSAHFIRVRGGFAADDIGGIYYVTAFSFMMQGFFFISGYFSKNTKKCHKTAVRTFLYPFVFFTIVMYFVRYAVFGQATLDLLVPSFGMWFFLAMFVYRYSIDYLSDIRLSIPLSVAAFLAASCFSFIGPTLALGRILSFFLFFIVGYSFDKDKIQKIRSIHKGWAVLAAIFLLAVIWLMTIGCKVPVNVWHLKSSMGHYGYDCVSGILLRLITVCIAFLWIFILIILMPDKQTVLTQIGQCTLPVFVLHIPIRYIIQEYSLPGNGNLFSCILSMILAVITVYLLSRPVVSRIFDQVLDSVYELLLKIFSVFRKKSEQQ